ncbi:type II toxin-antitoxin system VapC family toxin [Agromyces sp. MMS24-JH15]|uniref:type II toxin-antitoxin system VapC family toxin n=1 Tax=Agromyces sp. MMS24-JH15 TaxID=3243765 RepID=UPI003748873C
MIVLDASVVIAHLSSHDVHNDRAVAFFRGNTRERFSMHSLTLAEVLVGPVRAGRGEAVEHALASLAIEEWAPPEGSAARLARIRVESGMRLPDCCVLDAAVVQNGRIATFDATLASAAQRLGIEVLAFA